MFEREDSGQLASSLSERAAQWAVKSLSGEMPEDDKRKLEEWLASGEDHRKEYDKLLALWKELDGLKDSFGLEGKGASEAVHKPSPASGIAFLAWKPLAWAALIPLAIGGLWWHGQNRVTITAYSSAKGEQKIVTLADASTIHMNTDTVLSVEMRANARKVVLEKGEAVFTVTHDEARPFDVIAANGTIRDLGTQFVVYKEQDRVSVAVIDGAVEVGLGAGGDPAAKAISRGQRISYAPGEGLSQVEAVDGNAVSAWRHGRIIFDETPVPEAVRQMGRYWEGEIKIADSSLKNLKISGAFDIKDFNGFFRAMEKILPITVEKAGANVLILSKKAE